MNSSTISRLRVEQLDVRDVPAGNVAAFLSGGGLVLQGDAAANQVGVRQNSAGDIVVYGLNGTTVNGQSAVFVGRGIPNALTVNLGAGDDYLEVIGLFAGDIVVRDDAGNDTVVLSNVGAANNIDVRTGDGSDTIAVSGAIAHNVMWLDGGAGDDALHGDNSGGFNGTFVWNSERSF